MNRLVSCSLSYLDNTVGPAILYPLRCNIGSTAPSLIGFKKLILFQDPSNGPIIFHSIFFRHPEDFIGRNVLVVGGRASGCDVAERVVGHAVSVSKSASFILPGRS